MSLYDDLGLSPDADVSAIRAAYRTAAKRHHPDAGGDRTRFERIQRAHHVLSDPQRRERYDATGEIDETLVAAEAQAARRLLQTMVRTAVSSGVDLRRHDLVSVVLAELEVGRTAITGQAADVEAQLARLALASGRLSWKGDGEDVLRSILQEEAETLRQARPRLAQALRTHDAAAALLTGYSYRVEAEAGTISFIHHEGGLDIVVSPGSPVAEAGAQ